MARLLLVLLCLIASWQAHAQEDYEVRRAPLVPDYDPTTLILRPKDAAARRVLAASLSAPNSNRTIAQWDQVWGKRVRDFTNSSKLRNCKVGSLLGESGFRTLALSSANGTQPSRPGGSAQSQALNMAILKDVIKEVEKLGYEWEYNWRL